MNIVELIKEAKTSRDLEVLDELSKSVYMNVRAEVAKNRNIGREIANRLSLDPVANVSKIALEHNQSTISRTINNDSNSNCLDCKESEEHKLIYCRNCFNKEKKW